MTWTPRLCTENGAERSPLLVCGAGGTAAVRGSSMLVVTRAHKQHNDAGQADPARESDDSLLARSASWGPLQSKALWLHRQVLVKRVDSKMVVNDLERRAECIFSTEIPTLFVAPRSFRRKAL